MKPPLLKPVILITPISNVFVSILIIRSEYISKTEIVTKRINMMSNINPIIRVAYEVICIVSKSP